MKLELNKSYQLYCDGKLEDSFICRTLYFEKESNSFIVGIDTINESCPEYDSVYVPFGESGICKIDKKYTLRELQ